VRLASVPREYESGKFERFPYDAIIVSRKSRERSEQLVFVLPRRGSALNSGMCTDIKLPYTGPNPWK
jgi:hypothetical protein